MKAFVQRAGILAALISLFASGMAHAEWGDRFFQRRQQQVQQERPMRQVPRNPERNAAPPDRGADRGGQGDARRGRLSPEERQQLRRDIYDAGRDVYREPPGRAPHPRRFQQ